MLPRPARSALPLAGLALLGACAQQGDFGRPAPSAWNGLIETTGTLSARTRGEPASLFPLTDDEIALRDRAWRFLMPASTRDVFLDALANLTRARVLPPGWRWPDVADYHESLLGGPFASAVSRYRRLGDDATADARLIPPFAATAAKVAEADGLRLRSLPFVRTLSDDDVREAAMRVAENRCLVAWVRLSVAERIEGYRYAAEHLLIEVPGPEAVAAERSVTALSGRRALLDPLLPPDAAARCGLAPGPAVSAAVAAPPLVVKN
ncbi:MULTISPECIES: hypothetical protein [Methylobacterium]|uniref:Uncharacterized protein n=1 Tax=Methylobacterium jeotgali TaxID=381630 RepID=A0ABQ4SZQ2_9HYPH|nr:MULTISPECIES: hypothetical protein [Methylobacterium]GBU17420.1 hypothetical protein AwMethylo_16350 [Methylobacterium sp.]GJE08332.1 hypothetical protein AOPFMNJM_3669 [Methylobacterium jeotgali]